MSLPTLAARYIFNCFSLEALSLITLIIRQYTNKKARNIKKDTKEGKEIVTNGQKTMGGGKRHLELSGRQTHQCCYWHLIGVLKKIPLPYVKASLPSVCDLVSAPKQAGFFFERVRENSCAKRLLASSHIRPSARVKQLGSHRTDRRRSSVLRIFTKIWAKKRNFGSSLTKTVTENLSQNTRGC
jgi:hypothetical protein